MIIFNTAFGKPCESKFPFHLGSRACPGKSREGFAEMAVETRIGTLLQAT
ncbi:hypothetical protein SAMN04488057_11112 [Cyclobacterium lianum]|uniref:Uncharacterized protein n=1 Tax=Cyclobacterium lianum TaxID=388280 RepID=A0A1M7PVE3_9BACT|nr:hypothetical protein SAMN04488057_11112 [Cyclobacterium lianum]